MYSIRSSSSLGEKKYFNSISMPPKLSQYSHSPMPTPPSSPDEEEENAIFDPSEEENNNDITSALEGEDNDDNDSNEDIEDDGDENENNETITNLQASFQTRIIARSATNASTSKSTPLLPSQIKIPRVKTPNKHT
ncbi:hypothetical protein D6C80_07990 [Aureobasidium pullulans]|nr:hypothetical protein D6C80_07990 [Aureobasidium pullulans]